MITRDSSAFESFPGGKQAKTSAMMFCENIGVFNFSGNEQSANARFYKRQVITGEIFSEGISLINNLSRGKGGGGFVLTIRRLVKRVGAIYWEPVKAKMVASYHVAGRGLPEIFNHGSNRYYAFITNLNRYIVMRSEQISAQLLFTGFFCSNNEPSSGPPQHDRGEEQQKSKSSNWVSSEFIPPAFLSGLFGFFSIIFCAIGIEWSADKGYRLIDNGKGG